jgi:hypothetical protein
MTRKGDKLVFIGIFVRRNHGLNQGANPLPLVGNALAETINVVTKFGLSVKALQIRRVGLWDNRNW